MMGRPFKSDTTDGADTSRRATKRPAATFANKEVQCDDLEESSSNVEVEVWGTETEDKGKPMAKRSKMSDEREEDHVDEENEPLKTAQSGTRDKSASDKKTKRDDERMELVRPELGDHLDCTICLDKPASPIHKCANGHIICGICADQVNKCGLCRTGLHVSVFAERLSRQLELKSCLNQNSGCNEVLPATEIKNHLENCYYRDIICIQLQNGSCGNTKVTMHEYVKHLKERHNCHVRTSRRYGLYDGSCYSRQWAPEILEKDGHAFLLHSYFGADSFYFWMTVLGSKETAEKYMFEFKLFKNITGSKQVGASWKMPVVAFHDGPSCVQRFQFDVVIPMQMMSRFCTMTNKPSDIFELWFETECQIIYKICHAKI